eukprot:m.89328 g.89328  ORF g.89328 m.89328 type:complete len:356 (-) comp8530_c2_seq1:59-1126(-)
MDTPTDQRPSAGERPNAAHVWGMSMDPPEKPVSKTASSSSGSHPVYPVAPMPTVEDGELPVLEVSVQRRRVENHLFTVSCLFLLVTGVLLVVGVNNEGLGSTRFYLCQVVKYFVLGATFWVNGWLLDYGATVAWTRKIVHLFAFFWPQFLDKMIIGFSSKGIYTELWSMWVTLVLVIGFADRIRKRLPIFATMFASLDREEDRPNTLVWFTTQMIATLIVMMPFTLLFASFDRPNWTFIPILVNGIGDGLAEPIGKKYGRFEYRARAMCSEKTYIRTWEGSVCVYIITALSVAIFYTSFTTVELILNLVFLPIVMTFAEAVSPHSWDGPFLSVAGCAAMVAFHYANFGDPNVQNV